ncbi:UPF0280 family protein [Noviherbaspirillum aerium]|uniref:UPF0280 family protein n=1 Tax=Noviherbaspirillum aerium TaxID=2588497 RepID=UPI00124D574A|nr:UPF0280 family protein [Noviherbaspirillum aerium]
MTSQRACLPDGRLHFSHGPIDLVIHADGPANAVGSAHELAWQRFNSVLAELVDELEMIRRPLDAISTCPVQGVIARRMWSACYPFRDSYITPMAAVAGSVAQEIIGFYHRPGIVRAAVNNGGDIALHLSAGASYRIGVCTEIYAATDAAQRGSLRPDGQLHIGADTPVRGVATSGWRGRSFSLGIADSCTVLADTAAQADAAATVIANAVNVNDLRIKRLPACMVKDDSDLGDLLVTVDVPALESELVLHALHLGLEQAHRLQREGLIRDAVLACQGQVMHLGAEMVPDSPFLPVRNAAMAGAARSTGG